MLLLATALLCILAVAESATPEYTYMVIAPWNMQSNSTLSIPVHFATPVSSERTTAKLFYTRYMRDYSTITTLVAEKTVKVPNGNTDALIELPVPSTLLCCSYILNVSASGSIEFEDTASVYGSPKSMAIFIQTDKAMYKPNEIVQYRVFVVDSKLSMVDPTLDIEIFDPKRNKIYEEMGVRNKLGVKGELPLSDMPPLGRWRIDVTAKETNNRETYYFEVQEYVLPKFEVTVTLPSYGKASDVSMKGTAKAAYTFGKPVGGNLVLTVSKWYGTGYYDVKAVKTEVPLVNGEASFEIPIDVLKRLTRNIEYENFRVHANVTETITGITLDGEGEIRYHKHPYKIEFFPNMPDNFKPGFEPYKVWVKVAQQDGRPPETTDLAPMAVTVTYFTDQPVPVTLPSLENYTVVSPFVNGDVIMKDTKFYPIDKDGMVKFDLQFPNKTATATIKADFYGVNTYKEIKRFRSPTDTFLKVEIMNDVKINPLKIGDTVTIKVYSSTGAPAAKYLILSKRYLVESGNIVFDGKLRGGVAKVKLTRAMAPTSRFVVYYVKQDGEIVADGLNLVIEDIFENKVKVEFLQSSPQKPKASIDLKVTADKGSLVNVLAVDKSVKLLAGGNDITPDRVKDSMNRFGDSPWILKGWGPVMPWSFNGDDASDMFNSAQVTVLTDANLYRHDLWSPYMGDTVKSGFTSSESDHATGQVRKYFPETWMWKSKIAVNGDAVFSDVVPDTITEFVANAFAVNTETGLGVAPSTADLKVFLPFFVNLQLPYTVVRNEIAVIQANIFNYRDKDHNVLVTLKGSEEFEAVTIGEFNGVKTVKGDVTKCVLVKKDRPTAVFFNIRPLKIGDMMLTIRADISKPTALFDEVRRTLPVKAEGLQKEKNIPVLISLKRPGSVVEVKYMEYPPELVPDSERTKVTVFGDIFGPSMDNLDKLVRMPYGCGEQNMVNFAPSVFAVAYMRKTGRFDTDKKLKEKIKRVLTTGMQRQLVYQRSEGSFSAFGNADANGSLWLTAFVLKSFAQAYSVNVIFIDHYVIERAVKFIFSNQNRDGTLNNVGTVIHKALQGGTAASERSMMAYVLLALQEVKQTEIIRDSTTSRNLQVAIQKLTNAFLFKVPEMTSDYERAIGAYALKQVNSSAYKIFLNGLEQSKNKVEKDNKKYWKNPSRSLEIEIASYALLTYAAIGDKENGLSILNWLIDNRNSYGGFISTQDTVVALQAFSDFAALVYSKDVSMTIDIFTRMGGIDISKRQIKLDSKNHDVLQYVDFVGKLDEIVIEANGKGLAMIDVNQFYNVKSEDGQAYTLTVTTSSETKTRYTVTACARYNVPNSRSNMAIMEIGVVSGFEPMKDQVVQSKLTKRLEMSNGRLMIYFDEIPHSEVCVSVPVQRVSIVASVKPANVIVYSYYEPTERKTKSYLPVILDDKKTPLCKACDNECCNTDNVLENTEC